MFDFDLELNKLKSNIPRELIKPFDIAQSDEILSALSDKIENLSLQVEEIYEIIENNKPDGILLKILINVLDLLEAYFAAYDADGAGRRKLREILSEGKLAVIGKVGERLNPDIHKVISTAYAEGVAPEQVLQLVLPGYSYENKIIRKAQIVVSK